jgi:hypothetical protein
MSSTEKSRLSKAMLLLAILVLLAAVAGCAPQRPYRVPAPPVSSAGPAPKAAAPLPLPPPVESSRRPLPQDPRIREQDIPAKPPSAAPGAKESKEPPRQASIGASRTVLEPAESQPVTAPPLPDDSSLLAKITPSVSPQRAASLRLTEEGRRLLDAGEPARALTPLERTIAVDSTNPYGYFYLAKAQYLLGRYQQSMNFLDVAESRLIGEPYWLAEVHALRGENFRAQGQTQRAEISYHYALRLNSGNRTAAEALARMQAEAPPASR